MKILFPVDLSEPVSVTHAVERIAEHMGADLYVLHVNASLPVVPLDSMTGSFGGFATYTQYDPALMEEMEEAQAHAFHDFLCTHFSRPVHAAIRTGDRDAAHLILEDAEEHDVDLLVLGKRRHGRLEQLLLGSTAGSVIKHTTRPTLLMPIPAEE